MAKKQKVEEPENMERWMVSYADFMTLLFATFVVLYALSQVDISSFDDLQKSISSSFSAGITEGADSFMESGAELVEGYDADSLVMMEYLNPNYEKESYEDIKNEVDELSKYDPNYKNVSAEIDENGLKIKFRDADLVFEYGSAQIKSEAIPCLRTIGKMIYEKFKVHLIRVEGHTDDLPINSELYPSNWELSSARASSIVRYLIDTFNFQPVLFSAVGLAENRPIADNKTAKGRAQNRRVEIVILKNKYKKAELGDSDAVNQKMLEIEHLKLKNMPSDQKKVKFKNLNKKFDDNIIDIVPKQEIVVFKTEKKQKVKTFDEIHRDNQKMFSTR